MDNPKSVNKFHDWWLYLPDLMINSPATAVDPPQSIGFDVMVHATISHYVPSCLHMTAIQIDKWVIAICGHSIIQVNSAMSIKSILLGISQVIRLNIQEDHKW